MRQILERLRSPQIAFAAILLFGLLAMTARPATDPDLWWHLRTGQWIVETGHVPHSDPFSFTRAGHAWVSHEWLSEVVSYELWKHAGAAGLIVFSAIITTAGFMLLYLRCLLCGAKKHWAAAATSFGCRCRSRTPFSSCGTSVSSVRQYPPMCPCRRKTSVCIRSERPW